MGWLRKASLRAAGLIPLHDEDAIFATETGRLGAADRRDRSLDWIAGLAALNAVVLEGLDVVFIVLAIGAGRGLLLPAGVGAAAPRVLVLAVGAILRRPLSRVPGNASAICCRRSERFGSGRVWDSPGPAQTLSFCHSPPSWPPA